MDRMESLCRLHSRFPSALAVTHDLNVMRIAVAPGEADAPLVIDPDAIRSSAAALQQFKLVSRRHAKVLQPESPVQVQKLSPGRPLDGLKSPNPVVLKERRGIRTPERPDQTPGYDVAGIMSNVMAGRMPEAYRWCEHAPEGSLQARASGRG